MWEERDAKCHTDAHPATAAAALLHEGLFDDVQEAEAGAAGRYS